jgi:two-component sensor histidine kinase
MTGEMLMYWTIGISILCLVFCVTFFVIVGQRQKKYLSQILREQFKGGAIIDANIAQNIHDFVINEQIFDVLKHLRPQIAKNPALKDDLELLIYKIEAIEKSLRGISDDIFPAHILVAFARICQSKIRDLADLYEFDDKQITVNIDSSFNTLPYQTLLVGLYRLITSFVGNALKHHREANITTIKVELKIQNDTIVLSMSDNGEGFNIQKAIEWSVEMQHRGLSDFQNLAIALSLGANESDYEFYSISKEINAPKHGTFFDLQISLTNYLKHETFNPS